MHYASTINAKPRILYRYSWMSVTSCGSQSVSLCYLSLSKITVRCLSLLFLRLNHMLFYALCLSYHQSWTFAHTVRDYAIAQFALCIKAYFFRAVQFALRIYKAIYVFAICALKNNHTNAQTVLDYLPKCCNSVFVKVIFLKEIVKKNRN